MKTLTRKMVQWFLPDHVLIVPNREAIKALLKKHLPKEHLHKNSVRPKKEAVTEAQEATNG